MPVVAQIGIVVDVVQCCFLSLAQEDIPRVFELSRISECNIFTCGPAVLAGKPSGTSGVFSDGMATLVSVYTLQSLPMPRAAYLLASCQQTTRSRNLPV